jgi:histone-lysine N-methyltransferase SETD2
MPDLSTVYLPPFPELSVDAAGDLADDHAGDAAAATASIDAVPASASSPASVDGGGGSLMLPMECRWGGRVRSFDMAGADAAAICPAARRGGSGSGKKPSLAPSPGPSRTQAPARGPSLEKRVSEWAARKTAAGVPAHHCVLPFLTGAPKAVRIFARSASRWWTNHQCLFQLTSNSHLTQDSLCLGGSNKLQLECLFVLTILVHSRNSLALWWQLHLHLSIVNM